MPRSLRVAPEYIDKVKAALLRNGFGRQEDLAEQLEISRDTVSSFLNGHPVRYLNFLEICQKLGQNLEEIADFGNERENPQPLIGGNVYRAITRSRLQAITCLRQ